MEARPSLHNANSFGTAKVEHRPQYPPMQTDMVTHDAAPSTALARTGIVTETAEDGDAEDGFDPLFDDESDDGEQSSKPAAGPTAATATRPAPVTVPSTNVVPVVPKPFVQPTSIPPLGSANFGTFSPDILMTTRIDGQIVLWDRRVHSQHQGVGKLEVLEKTPPWCVSVRSRHPR